jgi:hypothetical protein
MDPFDYAHGGFVIGADKQSSRGVDVWGEDAIAAAADAGRNGTGGSITMLVLAIIIITCSLLMG